MRKCQSYKYFFSFSDAQVMTTDDSCLHAIEMAVIVKRERERSREKLVRNMREKDM